MGPTHTARRAAWASVLIICGSLTGCEKHEAVEPRYAELLFVKQTHHADLQAELSRLAAERTTPQLLMESVGRDAPGEHDVSERAGSARALDDVMSAKKVELMLQRMQRFYPQGKFEFDPIAFEHALRLRSQFGPELERYRQIFGDDHFRFHVALDDGLLADLAFLDHATLAHRLEAIEAQEALMAGQPQEAMLPLQRMFRIEILLGELPHVAARLTAARLRAEAWRVVQAVVDHPQASRVLLRRLRELADGLLANWPADADAWIGDRAMGLHAYEMVRAGRLLSILTAREISQLQEQRDLDGYVTAIMRGVDDDEYFYLRAMREVINSCEQPYYQRKAVLAGISERLEALRETPRYPLFAATVLLADLDHGQRLQALDRARCEAWSLALAVATGESSASAAIDPVTGQDYRVRQTDERVEVHEIGGRQQGESLGVPLLNDSPHGNRYTID